jgi:hypothetical protein
MTGQNEPRWAWADGTVSRARGQHIGEAYLIVIRAVLECLAKATVDNSIVSGPLAVTLAVQCDQDQNNEDLNDDANHAERNDERL